MLGLRAEVIGRGDEVVAEHDGGLVAPEAIDRQAPASRPGVVEHVVVHECRHVHDLAHRRQGDVLVEHVFKLWRGGEP